MIIKKNVSYTVQYEDTEPREDMERQQPRPLASSARHSKQDLHNEFVFFNKGQTSKRARHNGNGSNVGTAM